MSEALPDRSDGRSAPPPGIHLPQPSIQPLITGAGVAMLLFGVIAGPLFAGAGLLTLGAGIVGWIAELRARSPVGSTAGAAERAQKTEQAQTTERAQITDRSRTGQGSRKSRSRGSGRSGRSGRRT
jgi:hypothetical protein